MSIPTQPPPTANLQPAVWPLVIADMQSRDAVGRRKYGVPLQPFNGRDALQDAYEEALDLAVYLKQAIIERDTVLDLDHKANGPSFPPHTTPATTGRGA